MGLHTEILLPLACMVGAALLGFVIGLMVGTKAGDDHGE